MVGKILLAARDIITLELRERDNNPKPQKKLILFLSYEDV